MPAPRPRILFEDREILVIHRPDASDATLLTFADLTFRPDRLGFWGREAAEKLGLDAVGFVSKRENWFPTRSVEAAIPAVRAVLKPRSLAYGYSMGGHAALKHARRLGAQTALAVTPQISIAPAETRWDTRFHRFHRPTLNRGMRILAEDLPEFAAILADPHDATDWQHARLIAGLGPAVHLIRTPMLGHAAIWLLAGSEALGTALAPALAGDAAALRRALRARRGRSGHWFRLMGRAAYRHGHEHLAETLWSRAVALGMPGAGLGATRADALGERIVALNLAGRQGEAVAACDRMEAIAPHAPALVGRAAHLRLAAGDPAAAEPAFRRALALKPGTADLHLGLSLALSGQGRHAEALAAARAGHEAVPDDIELATHFGHLLNAGSPADRAEAEAVFRTVLARHSGTGRALLGLSSVLAGRGEKAEALVLARRAVFRMPGDLDALAWLARLLIGAGEAARAEKLFRRVVRAAPRRADGHLGLADVLRATGRTAEALRALEAGLAILPGEPVLAARHAALAAPPARLIGRLRRLLGGLPRR